MTKRRRYLRYIAPTVVTLLVGLAIAPQLSTWSNGAVFAHDTFSYQAMAVNALYGHGFLRRGGMEEDFSVYGWDYDHGFEKQRISEFYEVAGVYGDINVPVYPALLTGVYAVFGVNPLAVKWLQAAGYLAIGFLLPFVGAWIWGRSGYLAGLVAAPVFVLSNYRMSEEILTEPTIMGVLFIWLLVALGYEAKRSTPRVIALGLMTGVCLLTKGNLAFLAPLTALWLAWQAWHAKQLRHWLQTGLFCACVLAVVAPWSAYTSRQIGRFTLLSQQTLDVLNWNNEFNYDGSWHPYWQEIPEAYYNHDGLEGRSPFLRVAGFYAHQPRHLAQLLWKLRTQYAGLPSLAVAACAAFLLMTRGLLRSRVATVHPAFDVTAMLVALGVCIVGALALTDHAYDTVLVIPYLLCLAMLIPFRRQLRVQIPISMVIILVNFVLITLLAGWIDSPYFRSRHARPGDFVYVLLASVLLLRYGSRLLRRPFPVRQRL